MSSYDEWKTRTPEEDSEQRRRLLRIKRDPDDGPEDNPADEEEPDDDEDEEDTPEEPTPVEPPEAVYLIDEWTALYLDLGNSSGG